ncbi:fumarate hydratase subunit alpha [Dethiosulfatibacter aminovorans DSM 17477]|uniref:Fumarate hydratase subunit alpha n=1 Tax=Dethiosulfatibacter aminovorans DSM 17477 TaxID=1121476 RepID=A0A1M6D278_9FIRM|nr:fumarate hydratase [Dethiosulfatibacter aminovorans]SHI67299.1 fumarate hydratase subunit alpha [Dethiosulfatibacter aminovorans DSM 17477]
MIRKIDTSEIKKNVKNLFIKASYDIGDDMIELLKSSREKEESETAKYVLDQIIDNDMIAKEESIPMCQDTGMAVVFMEIGKDVFLEGEFVEDAINQGVREAYDEGFLRKSVVNDPVFNRVNTRDNTPAVIHTSYIEGDKVRITVAPKGFGSENMSRIKMLKPADGVEGVKDFVMETVKIAGPNPCPPIVVGVGIGGTFEKAAILSKKALTRELGEKSPNELYSSLEEELFGKINELNIGPAGLKGKTTCLGVHVNYFPTHIAGMPVAVNICCHAYRHASVEI